MFLLDLMNIIFPVYCLLVGRVGLNDSSLVAFQSYDIFQIFLDRNHFKLIFKKKRLKL